MIRLSMLTAVSLSLLGGCAVSVDDGGGGIGGDPGVGSAVFDWSFNQQGCSATGVQQVDVSINGASATTFPCFAWANGGRQGEIDGLVDGNYSVVLTGYVFTYDQYGNFVQRTAAYSLSSTITIQTGENDFDVDLTPNAANPTNSNIVFLWSFNSQSCSNAGVSTVTIQITDPTNGDFNQPVACNAAGTDGEQVTDFSAGSYPFTLNATDGSGNSYYASGTALVNGVSDTVVHVDFQEAAAAPTSGTGTLVAELGFGSPDTDCASTSNLANVTYFLSDGTGAIVQAAQTVGCSGLPISIANLTAPDTYYLNIEGLDSTNTEQYVATQYAVSVYPGETSTYAIDVPAVSGL